MSGSSLIKVMLDQIILKSFCFDLSIALLSLLLRKEVIQPHLPVQLPCYDFVPVICPTLGACLLKGKPSDFKCFKLP